MCCPINHNSFSAAERVKPGKGGHTRDDQTPLTAALLALLPVPVPSPAHRGLPWAHPNRGWDEGETWGTHLPAQRTLLMPWG